MRIMEIKNQNGIRGEKLINVNIKCDRLEQVLLNDKNVDDTWRYVNKLYYSHLL